MSKFNSTSDPKKVKFESEVKDFNLFKFTSFCGIEKSIKSICPSDEGTFTFSYCDKNDKKYENPIEITFEVEEFYHLCQGRGCDNFRILSGRDCEGQIWKVVILVVRKRGNWVVDCLLVHKLLK